MSSSDLAGRIEAVKKRVEAAAHRARRDPAEIRIVAISKRFPGEAVLEAAACGLQVFGENRVQEAEEKVPFVNGRSTTPLEWHLVGQLQRNKAARAVELFSVIHSVDRPSLADAISRAAHRAGRTVRVLLQVNVEEESQKGGVEPNGAASLLAHLDSLPGLEPLGLMAMPRLREDPEDVRPAFSRLRKLRDEINASRPEPRALRILSMGMSNDFEVAIEEGADWVRIGTAIFGERDPA